MEWIIIFVIMENTLPYYVRKKNLVHFELTEKSLGEEQFDHYNMTLLFGIEQKVMVPVMIQILKIYFYQCIPMKYLVKLILWGKWIICSFK